MKKFLIVNLFLVTFFIASGQTSSAATIIWDGDNGSCDGNFSTPACWVGGVVPDNNDTARFDSSDTTDCTIDGPTTVDEILTLSGYTGTITATDDLVIELDLDLRSGNFVAPPNGSTLTMIGNFNFDGGTFDANGGQAEFIGNLITTMDNGLTAVFNDLDINKNDGVVINVGDIEVEGDLSLTEGVVRSIGVTEMVAKNTLSISNNVATDVNNPNFNIQTVANFSMPAGFDFGDVIIDNVNNPSLVIDTTLTASSDLTFDDLIIEGGTFDNDANLDITVGFEFVQNGGTFNTGTGNVLFDHPTFSAVINGGTFNNQSSQLIFDDQLIMNSGIFNGGTGDIIFQGADTFSLILNNAISDPDPQFTASSGTVTMNRGLDIDSDTTFNGNGGTLEFALNTTSSLVDSRAIPSYSNITVTNVSDTLILELSQNIDVNGNIFIQNGILDSNSNDIVLAGNWSIINSGNNDFVEASGTLTLDGPSTQTISGSNTFNNFSKTNGGTTLEFESGETQTFVGTLTLLGASGNELLIRSTNTSTEAFIDPQGTRNIDYVDVQDNNNINSTAIDLSALNGTDSGNNTNWIFPISVTIPEFGIWMMIISLGICLLMLNNKTKFFVQNNG